MRNIDSILKENLRFAMFNDGVGMPAGVSVDGPFYHGSCLDPGGGPFENVVKSISEFNAIWVSKEDWVSEMFANEDCTDGGYKVVYEIDTNLENAAPINKDTAENLMEFFGHDDLREVIPYLERAGYDGWTTMASIGKNLYTDIAIFGEGLDISKMKVFIDGKWTEYFSPNEFKKNMDGKMKSDALDRFTRVMHV